MRKLKRPFKLQIGIIAAFLLIFSVALLMLFLNRGKSDVLMAPVEESKNVQEMVSQALLPTMETNLKSTTSFEQIESSENFCETTLGTLDNTVIQQQANDSHSDTQYFTQKTENLSFSLLRVYATKRLPNQDPDKVIYWSEPHMPDGTLTEHTYVFIDVTIKDLDNTSREIYLNSCNELYIEGNIMMPIEMRYRKDGGDANSKGYFCEHLNAREEKTYTLGYIIEDQDADKSLTLRHNPLGRLYDDSIRQYEIFPER